MPARPFAPLAAWFAEPEPNEARKIVIHSDGRLSGHALSWTNERLWGHRGTPRGVNYDLYHRRPVRLADAETLRAGAVLLNATAPGNPFMSAEEAMAHFDATGTVLAEVRAVEGKHGIWLSGAAAPDVDEEMVAEVNRRGLSGAWWRVDDRMALVSIFAAPDVEELGYTLVSHSRAISI